MEAKLHVLLLDYTQNLEQLVASAAKLCYSASNIPELVEKMTAEKSRELVELLMSAGHESPLEHAKYTFGAEGVSRALTHQLVRHRLASYSQQSQRYVCKQRSEGTFDYICPQSIKDAGAEETYAKHMRTVQESYNELIQKRVPPEDARFVLPNAAETKIIITMNVRELMHVFKLRGCYRAQWEIRALAENMYGLVYPTAPTIWKLAGPSCAHGKCAEGKFCCGKAKEVREKWKQMQSSLGAGNDAAVKR